MKEAALNPTAPDPFVIASKEGEGGGSPNTQTGLYKGHMKLNLGSLSCRMILGISPTRTKLPAEKPQTQQEVHPFKGAEQPGSWGVLKLTTIPWKLANLVYSESAAFGGQNQKKSRDAAAPLLCRILVSASLTRKECAMPSPHERHE